MIERFAQFPSDLARRARLVRIGDVPALLAHPDWSTPAPVMFWMHGRTVNKELDPGRYLRWVRAGIAACAVDLPGHGERFDRDMQGPGATPRVLAQMIAEIDPTIAALGDASYRGVFDLERVGIGGMSAGGMATLRRLCEPHAFACAAVEGTTGNLAALYAGSPERRWPAEHEPERVRAVDAMQHLEGWRPIPLLALHSEGDRVVPIGVARSFLDALESHLHAIGADPALVRLVTWPETGAPEEHAGFGRVANDAKNIQVEFLARWLVNGGAEAR